MSDFDNDIRLLQRERKLAEQIVNGRFERAGEGIYACFCGYCNAEGKAEWKGDAKKFGEWLTASGIELDFWQRKAIAENHFGYEYEWDGREWKTRKIKRT